MTGSQPPVAIVDNPVELQATLCWNELLDRRPADLWWETNVAHLCSGRDQIGRSATIYHFVAQFSNRENYLFFVLAYKNSSFTGYWVG